MPDKDARSMSLLSQTDPRDALSSMHGRPGNVKHVARCAMDKVGGRQKTQRGGILIYRYKFAVVG